MKQSELIERITRLEQQQTELGNANRRLRLATGALLLFAGAGVLMAQMPGAAQNRSLEAEQFVLRDSGGSVRGAIGIGENGTVGINLNDAKGATRISIDLSADGSPGVDLYDQNGRERDAGVGAGRNAGLWTVRSKRQVANFPRCSGRANSGTGILPPGRQAGLGCALKAE